MAPIFDVANLKILLRHFYILTKIRITVFDDSFNEIVSYPPDISPFCTIIRTDKRAMTNCLLCDQKACLKAKKTLKPIIYTCHAGLTEAITPIRIENIVIGYLFFGHISQYPDFYTGWLHISENCRDYSIDTDALMAAFKNTEIFSDDYIIAALQIMETVASYLCVSHLALLKRDSLPLRIDAYISEHLSDDLSSSILCVQFNVSRTKLFHIAEQNYGMGIAEYIRYLRIQNAKNLLQTTSLPINEVASRVGIVDYNYFTKMFKKSVGLTPKDFRKEI